MGKLTREDSVTKVGTKIRILVADGHTLFCEGICSLLKGSGELEVAGEASNGDEVLAMARDRAPDVVLMDAFLPPTNGVEVARRLRAEHLQSKILLLTQRETELDLIEGFRAGVNGFVSKKADRSALVSAIAGVCRGDYVVNLCFEGPVISDNHEGSDRAVGQGCYQKLSAREREILRLVADGSRTSEIAGRLKISAKTVLGHRANMKRKLGVHNQTELVKYAVLRHADGVGGWGRLWGGE